MKQKKRNVKLFLSACLALGTTTVTFKDFFDSYGESLEVTIVIDDTIFQDSQRRNEILGLCAISTTCVAWHMHELSKYEQENFYFTCEGEKLKKIKRYK